jgi:hypothetical protein
MNTYFDDVSSTMRAHSVPMNRKIKQDAMVISTKPVFHECESLTVDRPMNMNMIVSMMLDSIFKTYSVVASDFFEMLNETYCFMTMPQKVILEIDR